MRDEEEVIFLPNRIGMASRGRAIATYEKRGVGDYKNEWHQYKALD
jgi:hypothetical protein